MTESAKKGQKSVTPLKSSLKKSNYGSHAPKSAIKKAQVSAAPNTGKSSIKKVQVSEPRRPSMKKTQTEPGDNDSLSDVAKGAAKRLLTGDGTESKPDWYQELSEQQITMFKNLFELLDRDGGGSIDGEELFAVMKELDIGVTKEEIVAVIRDLGKAGNDEIDFDEFLYCMSCPERWMKEDPDESKAGTTDNGNARKYTKRETIFFTAITRFAIKNSMGDIERYYAAKARRTPHVIGHYTAGARLIGLTDRQIERHLADLQRSSKGVKSPYAKPLRFVTSSKKSSKHSGKSRKSGQGQFESVTVQPPLRRDKRQEEARSSGLCDIEEDMALLTLRDLADKGNIVAKLPGVHLVPQIRQKLASGEIDVNNPIMSTQRKRRQQKQDTPESTAQEGYGNPNSQARPHTVHGTSKIQHDSIPPYGTAWKVPYTTTSSREMLPLPHIKLSVKGAPTINDLPQIRKEVSSAVNGYYSKLRKRTVRTAWNHWGDLHADQIHSKTLQANLWRSYKAYSPCREEEAFVICPWIPGPVGIKCGGGRCSVNSTATMSRPMYEW
ncbi:uncharacterized protein LOC135487024 [Lineus longissimus]|uniref:uncharacterized protein LOC135487024 n=1 Tax=Lineus longissimus TaxID=88925 RepID=UPI00315C5A6F